MSFNFKNKNGAAPGSPLGPVWRTPTSRQFTPAKQGLELFGSQALPQHIAGRFCHKPFIYNISVKPKSFNTLFPFPLWAGGEGRGEGVIP